MTHGHCQSCLGLGLKPARQSLSIPDSTIDRRTSGFQTNRSILSAPFAGPVPVSLYYASDLGAVVTRFNLVLVDILDDFLEGSTMASRESSTDRGRKEIGPLGRETVLVTRPLAQSSEITRLLEERGATVVHCATIQITPPASWDAIDQAIAKIETYDWLVFTSANGAKFFFDRVAEVRSSGFQQPGHQSICAIGPATANAIDLAGARVDLLVTESRAEGVLLEIVERVGGEDAIAGLRFLLPAARHARELLQVELRKLGAQLDAVEAYQTVIPTVDVRALFLRHKIGVITFTSPSTVRNFVTLVGADLLAVLQADSMIACIGPVTTAAALEHGFKRIVQADAPNTQALVEVIARSVADLRK